MSVKLKEIVKAACIQISVGRIVGVNQQKCLDWLRRAVQEPVDLVVLPEFCNHVPNFESRAQAWEMATPVPGGFLEPFCSFAKERGIHIALNVLERGEPHEVFDTSVLIGPSGEVIGKYRKYLLFAHENNWFCSGATGFPVFETELGRIGLYICADGLVPETTRCLALNGAQMLINSLNSGGPDEAELHIPARAVENHVWILSANKVGPAVGGFVAAYVGGSQIVSPEGEIVARASQTEEEIIYGEILPAQADRKAFEGLGDLFGERKPLLYKPLVQSAEPLPLASSATGERQATMVKVAAIQVGPEAEAQRTLEIACSLCEEAAAQGARLLVLPELFLFDLRQIAKNPPRFAAISSQTVSTLTNLAKRLHCYLVASLVEAEDESYYSSAYLITDGGAVQACYRQVHLDEITKAWAWPGDSLRVYETSLGRLGLMQGFDGLMPEAARLLALQGADLILYPCRWTLEREPQWLILERAGENHVPIVAAARPDSPVPRGSMIVPVSRYPTQPHWRIRSPIPIEADPGKETFVLHELDLSLSHDKTVAANTDLFRNRRPELYEALLQAP